MNKHAEATFEVKTWEEEAFNGPPGLPKLSRASVTQSVRGDIEGEATVEYLMAHRDDGSADFVGLQRVVGRLRDRSGSFVMQGSGIYQASTGTAEGIWYVTPGSGTGELRGLQGEGSFVAKDEPRGSMWLDYEFD